ncbi:MAG: NAD(P)H-hydrate epimerase [Anaerolineae bacterium]|jgi:NAD(P)H-hydrate epimerase
MFRTEDRLTVPAVTAEQMREVDRIAMEDFGLGVLQMMENAGRNLAQNALNMLSAAEARPGLQHERVAGPGPRGEVTVLAGSGGNGGGGLCCARHLQNRGFRVWVVLSKEAGELGGAAANQLHILQGTGMEPVKPTQAVEVIRRSQLVVDALIGYSLRGAPRGRVAELITLSNEHAKQVLSLDLPSGLDATTGEAPGEIVHPERTLTLALPKTGLENVSGELYLADIGIPPQVYHPLGLTFEWPVPGRYWIPLIT